MKRQLSAVHVLTGTYRWWYLVVEPRQRCPRPSLKFSSRAVAQEPCGQRVGVEGGYGAAGWLVKSVRVGHGRI